MSEIEYDASGKSNLSFQVGADILNLLLLCAENNVFPCVINTLNQPVQYFY